MKRVLFLVLIITLVMIAGCTQGPRGREQSREQVAVPSPAPPQASASGQAVSPELKCTELKAIVILVDFPDARHWIDRSKVEYRFNTQVNNYFKEMSYGKYCLNADVTEKWYTMPQPVGEYRISSMNLEVNRTRVNMLIRDALNAADDDVDFTKYDFGVIQMGVNISDYGMVGLCGHPGMLGWTDPSLLVTNSGDVLDEGVAIFTAQAHAGTNFHDISHILGGIKDGKRQVPCLYDHDLQAQPGPEIKAAINLGYFDPLSCHYYKYELPPPGLCSWTKIRLGWMDPAKIRTVNLGETTEVMLGPLEDITAETLVIKIPVSAQTYYLIENRAPIGFDVNLPSHGVLIMYADDRIPECRYGLAPVKLMNANPDIPYLEGAPFDMDGVTEFTDKTNNVRITLLEKVGNNYRIRIAPAK